MTTWGKPGTSAAVVQRESPSWGKAESSHRLSFAIVNQGLTAGAPVDDFAGMNPTEV